MGGAGHTPTVVWPVSLVLSYVLTRSLRLKAVSFHVRFLVRLTDSTLGPPLFCSVCWER